MWNQCRTIPAVVVAVVLAPPVVSHAQDLDTLPTQLQAAQAALDAGDHEQAIDLAQKYTWSHQRDVRGFLILGDAYAERMPAGRFRAIRAYRTAERLDRTRPEAPYRIAMLGLELGGADGERLAADGFARTLERDPLYKNAWRLWLTLFRNRGGRQAMLERLEPHQTHSEVKVRLALLLMEEERYAEADLLLDSALVGDSTNVAWLALRAQSAFEADDTQSGVWYYRRALRNAPHDSTDALWKHAIGIASPREIEAWADGVAPSEKAAWLEHFWAVRNPDLFSGVNERLAEHFRRWRVARREFPLLHPLIGFQRDGAARALNLEPSIGERSYHVRCELLEVAPQRPGPPRPVAPGGTPIRNRPLAMGNQLWWLSAAERDAAKKAARLGGGSPASWGRMFDDPVYPLLGFDLRGADSTAARVGYNLATGLSDRGLTYLRLGPPGERRVGGQNSSDPDCFTTELEYWDYDQFGTLRFSKPVAFSEGLLTLPEVIYRPMEGNQYEATKRALTEDMTSEPAPLEFGVWTAQFRNAYDWDRSDVVVVSTHGALATELLGETGGGRERRQSRNGVTTLEDVPSRYVLLAHAQEDGVLGRQRFDFVLRSFGSQPAMSDALLSWPWAGEGVDRSTMLAHLSRSLVFQSGDAVRAYTELYGLSADAGTVWYRATYQLLKTGNVAEDYRKEEWPDAQRFEFERLEDATATEVNIETLDILPQWIPEGRYLLRIEVDDLVAGVSAGRSTIAFEVKD